MRKLTPLCCGLLLALAVSLCAAETPRSGVQDMDALLKSLRSPVASERIAASRALHGVTDIPETAVATLVEALGDDYFDVRAGSAAALVRMGAPAVPYLGRALSSTNYHPRIYAARALGEIGPPAGPAVPELGKALSDKAGDVRCAAAQAILSIGQADKVVKELLRALRDPVVSSQAAKALGGAGKAAVPELLAALRDADANTADAVALVFQTMGPEAAEATPALMALFRRDIEALRSEAAKVEDPQARRRLVGGFLQRRSAPRALAMMGAAAAPHLLELVKSSDTLSVQCACDVMARMGTENAAAVPELMKILAESADFGLRDAAIWALAVAAPDSPEVVALFRDNLCGKNPPLQHASAHCLGRLKAARALAEAVKHGTTEGRSLAKRFLIDMGKDARDAVPILKEAAKAGDADVKSTAEEILKAIEETTARKEE